MAHIEQFKSLQAALNIRKEKHNRKFGKYFLHAMYMYIWKSLSISILINKAIYFVSASNSSLFICRNN